MLTKQQLLTKVSEFHKLNKENILTRKQKSDLYQLLIDDYQGRPHKRSKPQPQKAKHLREPFYESYGRRGLLLWPCDMVRVDSSFVHSYGYCESERVLKIVLWDTEKEYNKAYAYAYHDVPQERYEEFVRACDNESAGRFYNRSIKGRFPVVGII